MSRRPRRVIAGIWYHVMNRAAGRVLLFDHPSDYAAFIDVLKEAHERVPIHLVAYCVMPNHWHLILRPKHDVGLSQFMHWLTVTHAQRWHGFHRTSGRGALYQGRFKAVPIQSDLHLLHACRYVERNALRVGLVARAEDWAWSSLWHRHRNCVDTILDPWPFPTPSDWTQSVNAYESEAELEALRRAIRRGAPVGDAAWRDRMAHELGLEHALRPRGRPTSARAASEKTPDPFNRTRRGECRVPAPR